jgi:hypothetical protein
MSYNNCANTVFLSIFPDTGVSSRLIDYLLLGGAPDLKNILHCRAIFFSKTGYPNTQKPLLT